MSELDRLAIQYWMRLNARERSTSLVGPPVEAFRRLAGVASFTKLPAALEAQRAGVIAEAHRITGHETRTVQ